MKQSRGFTLLEMIVAIGIFAVIAVVSYASLNRFLDNSAILEDKLKDLKQLQLAFSLVEQDMRFMSQRIVRDAYGDPEPLLMLNNINEPGELIRFTSARRNVRLPASSTLQRTAYYLENGDFIRLNWRMLDRDQDAQGQRHLLLTGVESVSIVLLRNQEGAVQPLNSWDFNESLPDGIEWQFSMENGKQFRRIFEIKHAPKN